MNKKKRQNQKKFGLPGVKKWQGKLAGYSQGYLYGWAINTEDLEQRVSLEICLDQQVIGLVSADLIYNDMPAIIKNLLDKAGADFCHGFAAEIGQLHVQRNYSARVANTDIYLPGNLSVDTEQDSPAQVSNSVYSDGGLTLFGYAINSAQDSKAEVVFAHYKGAVIAEARANQRLPGLRGQQFEGRGFRLDLPLSLADGNLHKIIVSNLSGQELNGSPIYICCLQSGLLSLLPQNSTDACKRLVSNYESYLPRSLAWAYYRDWHEQFALAPVKPIQTFRPTKLTVIFTEAASAQKLELSQASLHELSQYDNLEITYLVTIDKSAEELIAELKSLQADFYLLLRPGDTVIAKNLSAMLGQFSLSSAELVFADAEFLQAPWFKPAWNLEYALATDYFLYGALCRASSLVELVISNAQALPELWFWSLALRLDKQNPEAIQHFPYVVCHLNSEIDKLRQEKLMQSLNGYFERNNEKIVLSDFSAQLKVTPAIPLRKLQRLSTSQDRPLKVCLIIPTRDQLELLERCIASLREYTDWPSLEILVIDNGSVNAETHAYFARLKESGIRVLAQPGPFNFSRLNNYAVAQTNADIIGLMNNDIEAIHPAWLDEMLSHFDDERVAMVGAKLLWPNRMVQHGGVVLGTSGLAAHFGNLLDDDDLGDFGRNQVTQQLSAVTAACMLVRRSDWLGVKGLHEVDFPVAFNDVDLCLKLRALQRRIIWTPFARLLHVESASRGKEDSPQKQARAQREMANLRRRWGAALLQDPAYHPGLNLDAHAQVYTGFALPPRARNLRSNKLQDIPETTLAELKGQS